LKDLTTLPLPASPFSVAEVHSVVVDATGRVEVMMCSLFD
jgi:hypothetical protein